MILTVGGVNPQVDGDGRDAFVGAGDAIRLPLDLLANLIEVCEFLPFAVEEFAPFCIKKKKKRKGSARTRARDKSRLTKRQRFKIGLVGGGGVGG